MAAQIKNNPIQKERGAESRKTMTPEAFFSQKKTFFVRSESDDTVLLAVNPKYKAEFRRISWWDTVKERAKEVERISVQNENVLFLKDRQGNVYFFTPLNLDLYRNIVKVNLVNPKDFTNEEEMHKAFEETTIL